MTRADLIQAVDLFQECSREERTRIGALMRETRVGQGETLCREGEPGIAFYLLVEGQAAISVGDEHVGTLEAGSFFGGMALLDDAPRRATVTALTPVTALVLGGAAFRGFLDDAPGVMRTMITAVGDRLRDARAGRTLLDV